MATWAFAAETVADVGSRGQGGKGGEGETGPSKVVVETSEGDQLLIDISESEENLIREFREVIGSIAVLAEPSNTTSLSGILNISNGCVPALHFAPH